jgi:Fe-S cluster assembly protein SufD
MVAVRDMRAAYVNSFATFEAAVAAAQPHSPLKQLRRDAIDRFAALGFPTAKDEAWRFTPLQPLIGRDFEPGPIIAECQLPNADGATECAVSFPIPHTAGTFLLFENGQRPILCKRSASLPRGVLVCGLADALAQRPDLVEPHLARHADFHAQAFTALNTAFLHDGAFVYVPDGVAVDEPICLVFSSKATAKLTAWHRRCLIVAGAGSRAQIVESYDGADGAYFTNAVTEVVVGERAVLEHYRLQKESKTAFHIAAVAIHQEFGSRLTSYHIGQGGALARTDLNVRLDAEECECTLNGLYLADGDRLIDNHTRIDHAKPRCVSHELYKGILSARARAVFNGAIHVHPDAQKTDAKQTSQTLLLSDDAVIDAKPELEIYADDVKCTHGAAIGQLDDEALFYLRTRGIDSDDARRLLTYAFANEVIGRVHIEPLRAQLEKELAAPLPLARPAPTDTPSP